MDLLEGKSTSPAERLNRRIINKIEAKVGREGKVRGKKRAVITIIIYLSYPTRPSSILFLFSTYPTEDRIS